MDQRRVFGVALVVLILAVASLFVQIIAPFVAPILWAAILALVFAPLQARLARWLREGLAASVLTVAVTVAVILPILALGWILAREAIDLYQWARGAVEQGSAAGLLQHPRAAWAGRLWALAQARARDLDVDLRTLSLRGVNALTGFVADQVRAGVTNLLALGLNFVLTLFTLFFFLRDGPRLVGGVRAYLPLDPAHTQAILARLHETLTAVIRGTAVTAIVQGLLAGLSYWLLGVPFPVVLALLTTLAAFLPLGGTALVCAPAGIYLFAVGAPIKAIIQLAWGIGAVTMADNVLKPLLIGGQARIPTLLLFFGILGGLKAFGFLGAFLGPAIMALALTCLDLARDLFGEGQGPGVSRGGEEQQRSSGPRNQLDT